jgi:hypothetical protein
MEHSARLHGAWSELPVNLQLAHGIVLRILDAW